MTDAEESDIRPLVDPQADNGARSLVGPNIERRMAMYNDSITHREAFWTGIAETFHWEKKWDTVNEWNFDVRKGRIFNKWFIGGKTNMCYNAVDRHLKDHAERVAFYCEGNEVGDIRAMTYKNLYDEVTVMAGILKNHYGVQKGDRVSIYLPMVGIAPVAMMACARIGAVSSVVFAGFSAASLSSRMVDSQSKVLITAEGFYRGDKPIQLKQIVDEALEQCAKEGLLARCLVCERHSKDNVPMKEGRDEWYDEVVKTCEPWTGIEWMESEDPLFMLYTSGSTGKPKGLLHTTAGYMIYAATTHKYVFDYHPEDVYFCTGDIGWITGHTYLVYGPLLNCATSILFEGVPTHPTPSRWWEIVDKYEVSKFYTAPTAVRALMKSGEEHVKKCSRKSLRVLGSVGEPINKAAWEWYYYVIGNGHCDIVDSWWQTETGGIMITPLPGNTPLKASSATLPFFGIQPAVVNAEGVELPGHASGGLCIKYPWPGLARTIYGDHDRYEEVYFHPFKGFYFSGDGCKRDNEGYFWLTGRVDDVLNVSGHRLGTSEIECAINLNPNVVESAVIGFPHDIKGEGIYAYVTFKSDIELTVDVLNSVKTTVRKVIGPLATPDFVQPAELLPKTRSGKIMRRVLRKIAVDDVESIGDTSTLADPHSVEVLVAARKKWVLKK